MKIAAIPYILGLFACLAVLYPVWVRASIIPWALDSTLLQNIFPIFGLIAFAILWLHAMSGVFEEWLRRHINFDRYVYVTSMMVFFCLILHPLLLFISADFNLDIVFSYGNPLYIRLGIIGWLLLITYDIGKALKRYNFFVRHWNKILLTSTIGFLITFFHALGLGSDLHSGTLRTLWVFYGITAILATIYTYGVKPIRKRRGAA